MGGGITDRWWALALRGVAGVALGIAAFAWPGITLLVLVILLGAYLLVDGLFALVAGGMSRSWLLLLEGAFGVVAGIIALVWPSITAVALVFVIAAWAIVTGIAELMAAYRLRRFVRNEWLLVLAGVASLIFGILLVVNPAAGLLTIVWLTGAYALIFGVILLGLALRLRIPNSSQAGSGSARTWAMSSSKGSWTRSETSSSAVNVAAKVPGVIPVENRLCVNRMEVDSPPDLQSEVRKLALVEPAQVPQWRRAGELRLRPPARPGHRPSCE